MVKSPGFLSAPPDGWKLRTPATHDIKLFKILNQCDKEEKAASTNPSTKLPTPTTTMRNQLVSPDDFDPPEEASDNRSTSQRIFSPVVNMKQPTRQQIRQQFPQSPFSIATISNEEQEATGKMAMMCTVNREDKHGCD